MPVRQQLIWVKDVFVMGRQSYYYRHEPVLYGWKDGAAHAWYGGRDQDTVWEIARPRRSEHHPTTKPVELVMRALENSSQPGDLVYEPFAGSGTTLIATPVVGKRRCAAENGRGRPCGATPMKTGAQCFWHDPSRAEDVAEAQRLGGIRRKRERTLAAAYDFTGLDSVDSIRRLLEIATTDALGLENSIARVRVLIASALAGAKLLETGELEDRIAALESAIEASRPAEADPFASS